MAHTNSTTNYNLPQFLPTDKPAWLTDVNAAYASIDIGMHNAQDKADTAFADAGNAQADATTAINNAAAADAKASGALASIEAPFDPTTIYTVGTKVIYNSLLYRCIAPVITPGPWTGSDNWERITVDSLIATADSKIGSLTSLSTIDKTSIVNAINEVNGAVNRADVLYNKSTFRDDIGRTISLADFDMRNYNFIAITGYISAISSSNRFTILICNNKAALDANYYPICANEALGFARFDSTNTSIRLLSLKLEGLVPTGGATITEIVGLG